MSREPSAPAEAACNIQGRKPLDTVQRWMQAVIMHPGGVAQGIAAVETRQHLDLTAETVEQVIAPSKALTSLERLEVYSGAYYARLLECLREEFPVLAKALGEELFDAFAVAYLQKYPSKSYTLGQLGANFPRYLAETRPDRPDDDAAEPDWPEFMVDVASLERTVSEVFDGPGVEGERLLDRERLGLVPPERWPEARLLPVPCLKLLALRYPVNDYFTAMRQDKEPELPQPGESFLAITRRDYVVRRYPLSAPQYVLLSSLVEGSTVEAAIRNAAAKVPDAAFASFAAEVPTWFQLWAAHGFIRDIVGYASA